MKRLHSLYAITVLCAALPFRSAIAQAPPAGYNTVKTNYVFKDRDPGGATDGSPTLESENRRLPVDTTVTNPANNLPSLRIHNTAALPAGGHWRAMITLRGWGSVDIAPYLAHGSLEFTVKGAAGGEAFNIGFADNVPERIIAGKPAVNYQTMVPITKYGDITTAWRHVSIPLKDLVPDGSPLNPHQVWTMEVTNVNGDALEVWLNEVKLTSPDKEPQYPNIKVNQVGYSGDAEKYALVTGWYEDMAAIKDGTTFQLKSSPGNTVAYTGKLKWLTDFDPTASGEKMLKADFSDFKKVGVYTVSVDGLPDSVPFGIGNSLYGPLLKDVCRYYYYQHANVELAEPFVQGFAHPAWHADDAACPLQSDQKGAKIDVHGGWYDAGDFGKYVTAGATAVSDLLWTYEMFPSVFKDSQLNIPESGNGKPDLLDEIKVETDFLLRMQDTASGGFWSRVFPQGKTDARYISDTAGTQTKLKPTSQTANTVGALAHASIVYRGYDAAYAKQCLAAARAGWKYLAANPKLVPSPGGPYHDDDDANDRLYAAAELCRATGNEAPYNMYFLAHYAEFAKAFDSPNSAGHGVGGMEIPALLAYMKSTHRDPVYVAWFTKHFNGWRADMVKRTSGVWGHTLLDYQYYWGSNMPILTTLMDLVIGSKILGTYDASAIKIARRNLNYILGINPLAMSYVSGYGANSCQRIFSGIYGSDGRPGEPAGYMPGGANSYEGGWLSRFTGKCFTDSNAEWTTNEHTIFWNSGLVFSAALATDAAFREVTGVKDARTAEIESFFRKIAKEAGPTGDINKINPKDRAKFLKMLEGAPVKPETVLKMWIKMHPE